MFGRLVFLVFVLVVDACKCLWMFAVVVFTRGCNTIIDNVVVRMFTIRWRVVSRNNNVKC